MQNDRRRFIKNITGLTAGAGLSSMPFSSYSNTEPGSPKYSANDTIRLGLIGCNSMGFHDLNSTLSHQGTECIALCDVDSNVLARRSAETEKRFGKKPASYTDYRKMLDNKDIDAVIIGTPDHWHCLQMVHACEAGKDVYVEKPIANTIEECNLMVAAKNRYNRIVQVGQWQRSDPHWLSALDYVQSGKLGRIRFTRSWACVNYGRDFIKKPDAPVPAGVDYDMWLGPAKKRPFNPYRFHGTFRYFWDYAGGLMTDWGVHMIDMVLAGMKATAHLSVSAAGGKLGFPDSAIETPDTLHTIYDFGDFTMVWEQTLGTGREPYNRTISSPGASFTGNNATLVANRDTWDVYPETEKGKFLTEALPIQSNHADGLSLHTLNFLDCIRNRKQPNCTIEMGRDAALNAQLGNIAYRLKKQVRWNEKTNNFGEDNEANEMAKAQYRSPWKLPSV